MKDRAMAEPTARREAPLEGGETTRLLTAIWERLLRRSPIGAHENFFDLGGDSLLAITLFLEISQATGRDLPVTTILEAPTVAELAAGLGTGGAPPFFSSGL